MNHALGHPESLIGYLARVLRANGVQLPTSNRNVMTSAATDSTGDLGAGGDRVKDLGASGTPLLALSSKDEGKNLSTLVSKVPPCQYVVLRGDSATPELFRADNDEQAMERLQKEVRAGQTKVVYCYKLMCMETFVPSSMNIPADDIKAYLAKESAA